MSAESQRMRDEWDQRARDNAYHFIASEQESWSEEDFAQSGRDGVYGYVTTDLPRITRGCDPKTMTVLEIGCGAGRMTRPLAEIFGQVHAVDVSGEMIAQAKSRLADLDNVHLHHTNGVDLSVLGAARLDFAFSFVVFQHIPEIDVIRGYIRQVAERLEPGALFKFQVQGDPAVAGLEFDTWQGARFSAVDAVRAARENELRIEASDGLGEQYFWLSMRKEPGRGTEPHAIESALLEADGELLNATLLKLRNRASDKVAELQRAVDQLDERTVELQTARSDYAELRRWSDQKVEELQLATAQLEERTAELQTARDDFERLSQWSSSKVEELRTHIREHYTSWAHRIGKRLGLAPGVIHEKDND